MQTITSDSLAILKSGKPCDVIIRCDGIAGSLTILGEDIIEGSFTIDRNSISGSDIEIGCADTSELKFELNNTDHRFDSYKFEGAILTVDFIVGSEYIRAGKFIVDKRPNTYSTISIQALDFMAKFNKVYSTSLADGATLYEILQDCCSACNVTLYDTSITNGSVPCKIPTNETTYHEVVSMVAELSGANAWIDTNGELRLSWYGENQSTTLTIDDDLRFNYNMAENDILITGVIHRSSDVETIAGTDAYALVIESNDLVDESQLATLLTAIYNKVHGLIYRPFSFDIPCLPHLWQMDLVNVTDANGSSFQSIITNHNFTLNGLSVVSAKGSTGQEISYASSAPFTARQKSVLNKVIDLRAGQQITALDQAMIQLNELAANAQGFYQTVVTDPVTQARIDYMHNQPLLANSTIVYKRTSDGFFWTDNYQGESTVWTSGYTASGNIVAKTLSAVGINADWITAGSIKSQNFSGTGDGSAFSTAGTKINLNNGTIASPGFRLDSTGSVEVSGKITAASGTIGGFTVDATTIKGGELTLNSNGSIKVVDTSEYYGFDVSSYGKLTASYATLTCPAITKAQASSFGVNGDLSINGIGQITSTMGATFGDVVIGSTGTITMDGQLYVGGATYYCTISSTGAIATTSSISTGLTLTVDGASTLSGNVTIGGTLDHNGASIGFFNKTPTYARSVTAPSTITTIGTADATYSSNEQTMLGNLKTDVTNLRTTLNNLWTALNAYGLV